MHSTLCAFDTHEQASDAVAALEREGFPRHDLHIEHRQAADERPAANDRWDGLEREVAVGRKALSSYGRFFADLLGRTHPDASGHADTYAGHVERGGYVVVLDAPDEAQAQRAGVLLRERRARDLNVVPRTGQRPLRDIVGMRQAQGGTESASNDSYEAAGSVGSLVGEHASAAHRFSPTTGPDLREPETERAPGLRYLDKDKPL